jgi:hypothetical protein
MVLRRIALPVALMLTALALAASASAAPQYRSSVVPLPPKVRAQLIAVDAWRPGCPVALSDLRLLTVIHRGFDGRVRRGQLVVHEDAAAGLAGVFGELFRAGFRIRHMRFADAYGPIARRPKGGDVTASFECREAVPSPCTGGTGTGSWSNHAYGLAIDLNPRENPYVGCGQSRDPATRPYFDRSRHRRGMVSPRVIAAFAAMGWEWGGAWTGDTKDYMHFSHNGH